jgi:predicted MPP superfamily phosphohydrolase
VNWGWLLVRVAIGLTILATIVLSQRFWYKAIWRATARWSIVWLRVAARLVYAIGFALILLAFAQGLRMGRHGHLSPRDAMLTVFSGLWFSSALFAYLAVKIVHGVDRFWRWTRKSLSDRNKMPAMTPAAHTPAPYPTAPSAPLAPVPAAAATFERLADPSRRYFFRTASALAGAAPFLGAVYGFAAERINYKVRRVEIPITNLPPALDGLTIAQISDIHLSGYISRGDVRRAVDLTNDQGADITFVTGDLITGSSDPIVDCVEEVRHLHAPLGVWGCNGNHEIYAKAEDIAEQLFAQAGMKMLRRENAQITHSGAQFNLIGVDYQRERNNNGHRTQMLEGMDSLIRRDMPNILLSHNPNSFNRAAELGIELSLAGHTHGGQIQVEILDHRLSPARFISDYVAGYFQRPLFAPSSARIVNPSIRTEGGHAISSLYVNRGIGTVGAPVRLGVPPEISILVLRRA